ncbi:MAG: nicotinate-nucleotide adenylyltransferase [bacterium]
MDDSDNPRDRAPHDSALDDSALHGLFGGAFDPIHRGHLTPVAEAMRVASLSTVTYLPAAAPPHRPPPEASARHRLQMTRIAVNHRPRCVADGIELRRAGPSYTIDTLRELRRRHPRRRYALLLGLDALLGLERWHRWRALQSSTHIIALARPGWRVERTPAWWRGARVESGDDLRRARGGKLLLLETAPVAISATQVRARIRAGEPVGELLPVGVWDYIRAHRLYGCADVGAESK